MMKLSWRIDVYIHFANIFNIETIEEINYKLDNMRTGSFSPSTDFYAKTAFDSIKIQENKMMKVEYESNRFKFTDRNVTVENKGNYTKVEYKGSNKRTRYYLCLESECKYICEVNPDSIENDDEWDFYSYPCYTKGSNFDIDFNDGFDMAYNYIKNYDPTKPSLRRSLLEEQNKKNKLTKATKGYYHEEVNDNGYVGYFLVDDKLTIIKQTNSEYQAEVEQIKLVLNLDPETKSVKISDNIVDDDNVNKDTSGVEPKYYDMRSDIACKSFIPMKSINDPTYQNCHISIDYFEEYLNKEYNITEVDSNTVLKVHDIDEGSNDVIITLSEYEDITKLNEIIATISKFTKPIPDDKCFRYNITEDDEEYLCVLYENILYTKKYEIDVEEEKIEVEFRFAPKGNDTYCTNDDEFCYIEVNDNEYFVGEKYLTHKYVDFKGNNYITCEEKIKMVALNSIEARVSEVRRIAGIEEIHGNGDNGSVEYMVNIFLISLLFIMFI